MNIVDNSFPDSITQLIESKEEFNAIFAEIPTGIDFNKSMIYLYIFTCNYIRPCEIDKLTIDDKILKIEVKTIKSKGAPKDAVRFWQKCLVVKMDKIEAITAEFAEK